MIDEVIAGLLVNVISAVGARVSVAIGTRRNRRSGDDLALARWFDTYSLTGRILAIAGLPSDEE